MVIKAVVEVTIVISDENAQILREEGLSDERIVNDTMASVLEDDSEVTLTRIVSVTVLGS